ncbi:MAG TPA: methyltransferase domain-containing protein [Phenylobacterium sp.]|uniref:class I SAM-dependent methyltransferase n=1 Tax=Phenylobacterium sp. TaxID=1871053 RepID=UPI002B4640EC|nr:methyltransferase domain-containing protein [Phenylobacterium sp.]HKR87283.1 methyltransferase domain-containing protein [Phenylobacterium sp.]HKT53274.1 methyltransferase domain-containing protein [Caulobacteraceae bacterium]
MSILTSVIPKIMPYLDGSKFDENLRIKYDGSEQVALRNTLLQDLCRDKRILHIGCTDHVPLIDAKIADRNWLHGLITECSSYTLGVDIDASAVRMASKIANMDNMVAGDITSPDPIAEISREKFDVALFGEVVEHIPNPVEFLKRFRKTYCSNFKKIIITVPNAFRAGNVLGIARNIETINSDHRFFFTPYTISKVAVDAGYRPESVTMAAFTRPGRLKSWILNMRPLLAEDIVLVASH